MSRRHHTDDKVHAGQVQSAALVLRACECFRISPAGPAPAQAQGRCSLLPSYYALANVFFFHKQGLRLLKLKASAVLWSAALSRLAGTTHRSRAPAPHAGVARVASRAGPCAPGSNLGWATRAHRNGVEAEHGRIKFAVWDEVPASVRQSLAKLTPTWLALGLGDAFAVTARLWPLDACTSRRCPCAGEPFYNSETLHRL